MHIQHMYTFLQHLFQTCIHYIGVIKMKLDRISLQKNNTKSTTFFLRMKAPQAPNYVIHKALLEPGYREAKNPWPFGGIV